MNYFLRLNQDRVTCGGRPGIDYLVFEKPPYQKFVVVGGWVGGGLH